MRVRMKDIENDIDNAINNPNKSVEYFLFIFMINFLSQILIFTSSFFKYIAGKPYQLVPSRFLPLPR